MMKLLGIAVMLPSALAANLIWGSYPSNPQCSNCLDETFASCEGDYESPGYARCMCAGVGSTNMVSCVSVCTAVDQDSLGISWGDNVASGWYTYCIMFDEFKSLCGEAQQYVTPELWADPARCGNVDLLEGDSETPSQTTGGLDVPEPTSPPTQQTDGSGNSMPTPTRGPSNTETTTGTAAAGRTTSSSAAGTTVDVLPAMGMVLGLAVQVMGMNW
ncbi:hypothetical protein QBC37DRAFT_481401 [Rhypophila decipiens]|uniref:Lysozyme n=1 Tax=Rhypophila decipiens TaxID=261697 RepID=A0AAN7B9Y1_9PEZI|nr:hypothetical protein QBC37DRAFT_481401 [Rhypophila decipiens]